MEATVFLEISVILVIATLVAGIIQLLRQPLIIGHIITGLLVGPQILNLVHSTETIEVFSSIGIALLLFIIGLGLNPRVIKDVGRVSLMTGLGQVFFTSLIGFGIAYLLGYSLLVSAYIAVALTFSSTIIILKLLGDKKELSRLHGKIATGFLLVQDLVAALILIVVSASTQEASAMEILTRSLTMGTLFIVGLVTVSIYVLPRLTSFFARSQEFLFLFSIGWGLGIASLVAAMGFSIEIGALAAGVALASSPYSYEISSRMRPLRDFFIILFFIILGSHMAINNIMAELAPALIFSAFILVGNPIIVMTIMGIMGYARKTSFKAGLTVAQISEFSLVLVLLAFNVGHISDSVVSMVTLVGMITIAASTYLILYDDALYKWLEPILGIFERKSVKKQKEKEETFDIIMFGFIKGSHSLLHSFKKLKKSFLVVDYDPEVVGLLEEEGVNARFGDAGDSEFLEELPIEKAKMVLITLSEYETNLLVAEHIQARNPGAVVIAKTDEIDRARELYDLGANYVMMPHYIGSSRISTIIERYGFDAQRFAVEKERHQRYLVTIEEGVLLK